MLAEKRVLEGLAWAVVFGLGLAPGYAQVPGQPVTGSLSIPSVPGSSQESAAASHPVLNFETRADIFMARKMYPDAIDYYRRAVSHDGTNAELWNKLGIAYQMSLDYRNALQAYRKATRVKPDLASAWNNQGTIYFLQGETCKSHFGWICSGRFKTSIKNYQKALELDPKSASFHMNMGASYSRLKKYDLAFEEYRQALALDPNVLSEHSSLGTVVEAGLSDVEYYYYLAKVFASLKRPDDSVRYLRRAMEDGFHDFKRLDKDPDFLLIANDPAYVALRKSPPFPIPE